MVRLQGSLRLAESVKIRWSEHWCLWRPLAESGHAAAQYSIGWMYANGEGLSLDEAEALRWWHPAAEQGHADA